MNTWADQGRFRDVDQLGRQLLVAHPGEVADVEPAVTDVLGQLPGRRHSPCGQSLPLRQVICSPACGRRARPALSA